MAVNLIHLALKNAKRYAKHITTDQHSFYYSGVGTRGSWLKRKFNAMFAPPYGDMDDIIAKARADLTTHFSEGDTIYIFGFSRGAAIARMFAAHLPYKVKFLGVFDTVAATRGSLDLNPILSLLVVLSLKMAHLVSMLKKLFIYSH